MAFTDFLENNPTITIGGAIVGVLVIGGILLTKSAKTPATTIPNASLGNLSGLDNGVAYRATTSSFTTENIRYGPQSNDPNLTTITNSPVNSNNPTTTTSTTNTASTGGTIGGGNPPSVPAHSTPPPQPQPTTTGKLIWDTRRAILGGETLSGIATSHTAYLRTKGMPGSMSVTWQDLYAHNTGVINETAAAHHNPIPGGPWNDIFPGEVIIVPRWG